MNKETEQNRPSKLSGPETGKGERLPYTPPQIISVELLETAAGTCDGTSGFGKSGNTSCNDPQKAGS